MKLRTSLTASYDGSLVDATDENLICDAAAAHALMEAITAWGKHPGYQGGESWVKKRADEIMAQWGFDSGEVRDEAV